MKTEAQLYFVYIFLTPTNAKMHLMKNTVLFKPFSLHYRSMKKNFALLLYNEKNHFLYQAHIFPPCLLLIESSIILLLIPLIN